MTSTACRQWLEYRDSPEHQQLLQQLFGRNTMNTRIQELSRQAHQWAVIESKDGLHECKVGSDYFLKLKEQKFAELIVKECAAQADYFYQRNECVSGRNIKQHFGVE